jgi:alpha-mannosidase
MTTGHNNSADTKPLDSPTLHIITHLEWEREGQHTFDRQRADLLDTLAHLVQYMQDDHSDAPPLRHFLLGGQTILLDDIASVRSNLLTSLVVYNAGGRLGVGPWYVQTDGMLAGGESLIRNLLIGQADAERHGVQAMQVAYLSGVCQHTAQLPQILRGFEIHAAFLCADQSIIPLPFRWDAPDGSHVLVMTWQDSDTMQHAIERQQRAQPDGPFLWLNRADTPDAVIPHDFKTRTTLSTRQSTLRDYVNDLRRRLPDELRPRLSGEVHLQRDIQIAGRFSARMPLKQASARLQAQLAHGADPLLALALTHGSVRYPDNARSLLDYSWRLLLQNQARSTGAGAISDDVQAETELRSRRIDDNSRRVIAAALDGLPGTPAPPRQQTARSDTDETYLTVWNPHGHRVAQVVEIDLRLPPDRHPAVLTTADGDEQAFHWEPATQTLGFRADVPPMGYRVYTLQLGTEPTAAYNHKRTVAARLIGSASGQSLGFNNGRLEWTFDSKTIPNVLSYYDGGDAGDIWQYQEPQPDVVMRGNLVDVVQVEATPTYERLLFRNRMRIAPALKNGISRTRGLRVLDIATSATYYHDVPGIHFRTTFSNSADDHRLRAHLRTGLTSQHLYTDGAFALLKRPLAGEGSTGTQPMQTLAALYDETHGIGLFTRGLPAFEPLRENGQVTLALTLLRSVGWLNKEAGIAAPGAQVPGELTAEFMLQPLSSDPDPAALLKQAQMYSAPLRVVQYDDAPSQPERSYLQLDDERILLSTLKPPQKGRGWIVRLLNPTQRDVGVNLVPGGTLQSAVRLNMAEAKQADYAIENNRVNLTLEPCQVLTVRLQFE